METFRRKERNNLMVFILVLFFIIGSSYMSYSQEDHSHFSKVFNKDKPYRIFLPDDYKTSQKRYPVIYYFHGNTGTHEFDMEGVNQLVKDNSVILVAWNGRSEDSDIRPYNIGNHSNIKYQVQFSDYFLELVSHIDSHYKTLTNRSNRAVIGHSMGGIMSFFLAGKYPDLIGVAANSKGSPEFFIGYPDNHSLYHVRYMFKNLLGVKLRFSSGTTCELFHLNNEVHGGALLEQGLDYEFHLYEGSHKLTAPQFADAFNFVVSSFKNPLPDPKRWSHADLYSNFDIWGYEVRSNLSTPGFIELKGVTNGGMGITTRKWQPDGKPIPGVKIDVKTPAIYSPRTSYTLLDYNQTRDVKTLSEVKSDAEGKISFSVNHENHQIGFSRKGSPAEIVFTDYKVNDKGIFLDHEKECNLKLRLLNRGGTLAKGLKATLTTTTEGVSIANPTIAINEIPTGELLWLPIDFKITANNRPTTDGTPFRVRFNLSITDNKNQGWNDEFDAPVFYNVPEFTNIGIDDGDSEIFGSGNGNNIAEPGEHILIYEISNGSQKTRLYYDDPYVDDERLHDEIQPDKWGDGYSLSSIIHIAEDCPPGHQIKFLASKEIKEWKSIKRNVTWGTFTITVGDNSKK